LERKSQLTTYVTLIVTIITRKIINFLILFLNFNWNKIEVVYKRRIFEKFFFEKATSLLEQLALDVLGS